jgi:hypothetical protein
VTSQTLTDAVLRGIATGLLIPVELRGHLTTDVETAGRLLGLGRAAAYRAAQRGEIPTLRLGGRKVVPVPRLLALVGLELDPEPPKEVTPVLQLVTSESKD